MDQKTLKKFINRRHPKYAEMALHWAFAEQTYEGGRDWFDSSNIHKYVKEGDSEYKNRLKRAYRFNHTKEVVDLVDKYLFKMEITRNEADAPESVKNFWKCATQSGLGIKEYARRISNRGSVYGRVWVVVDNAATVAISKKDEKEQGASTYSYIVTPENAVDMSYDERGQLNWILIHEQVRDDEDPIESSGDMIDRYRLWTRDSWTLFTIGQNKDIKVEGPFAHEFGEVPVFAADCVITPDELYTAPGLIDDVVYLDRAVANYLSNLDAIIQDQTFSQLAMPAQGLLPGENGYDKLISMGTKRVFTYDGEGGAQPFYLSPDVKQSQLILTIISKIINEIYHTVGLAGERTKEDNSQGIDNSSGVAKAYDFERVNSLLSSKADSLEMIENKLAYFVAKWHGEEGRLTGLSRPLVQYPENFDVRGLYDEFDIAARLAVVEAPDNVRREQMKSLVDKLFPKLADDLRKEMLDSLKSWPPKMLIDPATGKQIGTEGKVIDGTDTLRGAATNSLANKLAKET